MSEHSGSFKLLHVVGTRPNFMKVAPIMAAVERWNGRASALDEEGGLRLEQVLVHTGQHYDEKMSKIFFEDLGLPQPDHYLEVGSGSHAQQTAKVMMAIEPVLLEEKPGLVVVVGDVNSTLAAALVATKLHIPVAHVEAGLRSRDRGMPEEINRLLTDQIADLLFTTSRDGDENLLQEGILKEKIHFVGNPMIDSLETHRDKAARSPILSDLGLEPTSYGVVTLHRPSNVDDPEGLDRLVGALTQISREIPLIWPVHARTRARLTECTVLTEAEAGGRLRLTDPLGYLDFLALLDGARLVLTDSGGIQEETTVLGVPCLTLRKNTERPVTVWEGTNRLVDPEDAGAIVDTARRTLAEPWTGKKARRPELWDGRAAERIVAAVAEWVRNERGRVGRK